MIASVASVRLRGDTLQPESRVWDPGRGREDKYPGWERTGMLNKHLQRTIHCAHICAVGNSDSSEDSRTELDSHSNMPVVGKNCFILADTGKTAEVSPYTPD